MLYLALMQPNLNTVYNIRVLRSLNVSRGGNTVGRGLEGMSCKKRMRVVGWSSLEKRRWRDDFTAPCSILRRGSRGRCRALLLGTDSMMHKVAGGVLDWALGKFLYCEVGQIMD